jgi:hypothetical protein
MAMFGPRTVGRLVESGKGPNWRPDSARGPRQLPTVFRMLPKCASMWLIRPLVMSCSAVIGGASVKTVALVAS